METPKTHHRAPALEGRDIICFANDWDSDPLSKKHIMTRLARRNRVLWVNSIGTRNPQASARDLRRAANKLRQAFDGCRQVADNIHVFSPIAIPFHGNATARQINRVWLSWSVRRAARQLGFHQPVTWTFLPSTAGVAGSLGECAVIYHCVDEFSEFSGSDKAALLAMEERLLKRSAVALVSSQPLLEAKRPHNPNTFLVTHGVDVEHFRKTCDERTIVPGEIAALPKPLIGFFGLIADWVDLELVKYIAQRRPAWSVVLIGKCDTRTGMLHGVSNVHLLGQKKYSDLPAYCKGFDVAMLPFVINPLTRAANPLKLREYLAAGLPVVATAIPEAERLRGLLHTAETYEQFLHKIDSLLARGAGGPRLEISRAMEPESWDEKVRQMIEAASPFIPPAKTKPAGEALAANVQEICPGNS